MMEVGLACTHLRQQPEKQVKEGRVQEGVGIALWGSEGNRDDLGVGAEHLVLLLEVPVEDLRDQAQETGEEGVVFLGESGKVQREELLEHLGGKVQHRKQLLFLKQNK